MAVEISSTTVQTDISIVKSTYVPETSTSEGIEGQEAWDENFYYKCIAPNLWARTSISTAW